MKAIVILLTGIALCGLSVGFALHGAPVAWAVLALAGGVVFTFASLLIAAGA